MAPKKHVCFLFFISCLLVTFAVSGNSRAYGQENTEKEAYRIDIGDVLEINVWKEDALSKQVFVRLDGRISLPLVGDVVAAGMTPMELSTAIAKQLSEIMEEPSVAVILTASNSRVYFMVGNINNPGAYPINTPVNLLQAIAKAGGLGEWAKKDEIIIVRRSSGKDEMFSFDYDKFVKGREVSQNIMIQYGDTIIIP